MTLTDELKKRIQDHLAAVQQHLGDLPADEKREIIQSLETHIHGALETRSSGTPTTELLETILTELDPPESYSAVTPLMGSPRSNALTPPRKTGFLILIGLLTFLFVFIWMNDPFSSHWLSGETPDAAPSRLIMEGVGLENFSIGMTREALIRKHGAPQPNHPDWLLRWDSVPFLDIVVTDEGVCREIRFNRGISGGTADGIKPGILYEDACGVYGEPEFVWTRNGCVIAEWPSKGIRLWTADGRVTQIIVFRPRDLPGFPFKDDPAIIGKWIAVDFIDSIDSFNPARQSWTEDLFIKELTFLPAGTTSNHWKWSNGRLRSENTLSRYSIREIDGKSYLFMEWMSGDVTLRGQNPGFYVFEKE
ncbi:hypothetical protein P4B35_17880 [Pontiellaceae bacterium B12227]|nr:hypothetical protein [Pontiellaceae bacterium B12227]